MTDPIRRDPTEFLRVLKKMATQSSWQKSMLFASKGRMVGYRLTLDHYNTVLYSQSVWGRALEIVRVVRSMNEDQVQMNGATYYYICNGMANADHGWNYDFKVNHRLERLQHWRVALNALSACEANGFDATDTMHNSAAITCVIPGFNRWREAAAVLGKMVDEDRKIHPNFVKFMHDCLMRNMRPCEATALLKLAAERQVEGYNTRYLEEADVFAAQRVRRRQQLEEARRRAAAEHVLLRGAASSREKPLDAVETSESPLLIEEMEALDKEAQLESIMNMSSGLHSTERNSVFRPRVYRQQWHRWHSIANKYRPRSALKKKQLAPRDSPTGIPAFYRL